MSKTIRNFKQETTDKINKIKTIYKIASFAETVEFITNEFIEQNFEEIKKQHEASFKSFLATNKKLKVVENE